MHSVILLLYLLLSITHVLIIIFAILLIVKMYSLSLSALISILAIWLTLRKLFLIVLVIAGSTLGHLIAVWKLFVF